MHRHWRKEGKSGEKSQTFVEDLSDGLNDQWNGLFFSFEEFKKRSSKHCQAKRSEDVVDEIESRESREEKKGKENRPRSLHVATSSSNVWNQFVSVPSSSFS